MTGVQTCALPISSYSCYAYSASGNEGVSLGLRALQKVKDGEALTGGGRASADDFGDVASF